MIFKGNYFFSYLLVLVVTSCDEPMDKILPPPLADASTTLQGKVAMKVSPYTRGMMTLLETLQPQYIITNPKREVVWLNDDLSETSRYTPPEGWSLNDAVTHPSGHTSTASVKIVLNQGVVMLNIKLVRILTDGTSAEFELNPIPSTPSPDFIFIGTLDRVRLVAYGEDLFVTVRWMENQLQAYRLSFAKGQFTQKWVRWVEPSVSITVKGIIGGGFDNFHQGDYNLFVYNGVDKHGNLYTAVPSFGEIISKHDTFFEENLLQHTDPSNYEYGVAILTKFSPDGDRLSSTLIGNSSRGNKHMLNMRVSEYGDICFVGRIRLNSEPNGWDAWLLSADVSTLSVLYESTINIKDGDMLWDITSLPSGEMVAVGSTGYTQNPTGLSVSDSRVALAVLLNNRGQLIREIDLPQGPVERGNEAMSVNVFGNKNLIFSGAHNAPGTHAGVYGDGFVAIRSFN